MLSFFIVESTNVSNILHGDNKDLLVLLLVLLRTNILKSELEKPI
jgi:hypothetical protein